MNVSKSRAKIDIAVALGKQFEGMAEEATRDVLRQEGARDALKLAADRVAKLGLNLDKAFEDGELTKEDLKDPKKVEIFIKKWLRRAVGVIDNLATTADVARMVASGREKGIRVASQVVQNMGETEAKKVDELMKQLEAGELSMEDVGPAREAPLSLKYQRQDADAAQELAESGEGAAEKPSEEVVEEAVSQKPLEVAEKQVSQKAVKPKKKPKKQPMLKKQPKPKK